MGAIRPLNITWVIITFIIICNIVLFQMLFNNVSKYADKVTSSKALAYDQYE